jgi:fatty acid-binding protein DegV
MKQIAVVTDSVATLSAAMIEKYEIRVLPMILEWDDHAYRDGVDITLARYIVT